MIVIYTVDEILKMKYPYQLYTGDEDKSKKEYRDLLKKFHPDSHGNSDKYTEAIIKIKELYIEATELMKSGNWIEDGRIRIKSSDGNKYLMDYNVTYSFELGTYYIGNNSILYLIDKSHSDFIDNELNRLKNLKYVNNDMKSEFERYFPKILKKFDTLDEKIGILIEKTEDVYSLKDILNYYGGKVPARHVVWILSSIYNITCYLYYNKLSHNGITIDNYYISPLHHSGLLLGGWWYTVPLEEKLLGVSSDTYNIMSPDMKDSKKGTYILDLESIRLIGRTLLGDKNGISIVTDTDIPKPLCDWVRGIATNNPMEEYKLWDKVIIESYGERKFIEMNIDKNKIYNR